MSEAGKVNGQAVSLADPAGGTVMSAGATGLFGHPLPPGHVEFAVALTTVPTVVAWGRIH
jgi:hypothetical protein